MTSTIRGRPIEYNEEPTLQKNVLNLPKNTIGNKENGKRIGTIDSGTGVHMEEGEQPGGIADAEDERVRNAAMEEFASKIKKAVSAKLMGKKINLKLNGHKDIVAQVTNMIKLETDYLNALITGQAANTPALQKNKAIIDSEAKKLDRMMGTSDFWPFK